MSRTTQRTRNLRNRRTTPASTAPKPTASGPQLTDVQVAGSQFTLFFDRFISLTGSELEVYTRASGVGPSLRVPILSIVQTDVNSVEATVDPAFPLAGPLTYFFGPTAQGIRDDAGGLAWGAFSGEI